MQGSTVIEQPDPVCQRERSARGDLRAWLWLWLPLGFFPVPFLVGLDDRLSALTEGETGIAENLTVLILLLAIVGGVLALKASRQFPYSWFRWWIAMLVLGCVYFAGEELSWGQHFFGWSTPEAWCHFNKQDETNIHNTLGVFDNTPRNLLSLAALVGGVIVPCAVRIRGVGMDHRRLAYWVWPTCVCTPICLMALLVRVPSRAGSLLNLGALNLHLVGDGEWKECFLAAFLAFYLLSLYRRLQTRFPPRSTPTDKPSGQSSSRLPRPHAITMCKAHRTG